MFIYSNSFGNVTIKSMVGWLPAQSRQGEKESQVSGKMEGGESQLLDNQDPAEFASSTLHQRFLLNPKRYTCLILTFCNRQKSLNWL